MLDEFKEELIGFCLAQKVLQWGEFTLKSGRKSPYFFNAGCIADGLALQTLGAFYACYIQQHGLGFDVLFGPAYKGITLASATAMAMEGVQPGCAMPFAYNRKEAKDHGEGGMFVGPMRGDVCVIDDVITSGATVDDVMAMLPAGVKVRQWLVCLDRQEQTDGVLASKHVAHQHGIEVHALIGLDDLIAYLEKHDPACEALSKLSRGSLT